MDQAGAGELKQAQQEKADELEEAFGMFENWDDRYQLLIDIGRKLPPMPEAEKAEENLVKGCQSRVWVAAKAEQAGPARRITFDADSDSAITKGLVALLWEVYSGQTAENIVNFDVEGFLDRLGLSQHLSPNRRNGLSGMVTRIKTLAALSSLHQEAV